MLWLVAALYIVCKADHVYNKDESYYYLRKILGVGRASLLFTSIRRRAVFE